MLMERYVVCDESWLCDTVSMIIHDERMSDF